MKAVKVVIADDHKLFLDGIVSLLSTENDVMVVGTASNGRELLEVLSQTNPDVALVDLSMPIMDGVSVMQKAKKDFPGVKFIALTMHDEGAYIVRSVRSGAQGYLLKNTEKEELKNAIHTVYHGGKYFNKEISSRIVENMASGGDAPVPLSPRELEVLKLVSEGKTTKEIANELFVSTRTVETHRANMMRKLEVMNTAELIRKATKLKLL